MLILERDTGLEPVTSSLGTKGSRGHEGQVATRPSESEHLASAGDLGGPPELPLSTPAGPLVLAIGLTPFQRARVLLRWVLEALPAPSEGRARALDALRLLEAEPPAESAREVG